MTSSSGTAATTSSGSSLQHNSGSEKDVQLLMDQRKRKRMISNRESARRSRMRKQKHLDDLMAQLNQLKTENEHIMTSMSVTTQHFLNIESENSILAAQMAELSSRLQSLNEIVNFLDAGNGNLETVQHNNYGVFAEPTCDDLFMNMNMNMNNPMNYMYANQHPIMASADMLHY
ncbi:Basic leucine-zipper 44 [Heracleum sosnowskyi]|uniref:Basic leucine-zipper 44 n=1 Tax=Heracleum sosnowskyi TaxID=360622 RepID=A0AAD8HNN1_9APIA|nr:Basic leucine-zipper 44 [Heracleum sosnowskyi]